MAVETPTRAARRPPPGHPDRRPLLVGLLSTVLVAVVVGGFFGPRSAWRWWDAQPLELGPSFGGPTIAEVYVPHLGTSFWLVDQPKGVVEVLPVQLGNASGRAVRLDGVDPLFGTGGAARLRAVGTDLQPRGPMRAVAGFVLAPGRIVQRYVPVRAEGCDSAGADGTVGGAYSSIDSLTVFFHRLGRDRTASLPLGQSLVVSSGDPTTDRSHLTCVAPPG